MKAYPCEIPLDLSSPYYIKLDERLTIRQSGPLLKRLLPQLQPGDLFSDYFDIATLEIFDQAKTAVQVINVVVRTNQLHFNGNIFYDGAYWLLLIPDMNEIGQLGIKLDELPECSGLASQAHSLAISKSALKSSREVAERLNHRVKEKTQDLANKNKQLLEVQSKLLAAEKASSLNKLISGIAHEVNTPLGVIITSASLFGRIAEQLKLDLANKTLSANNLKKSLQESQDGNALIVNNANKLADLFDTLKLLDHHHDRHCSETFNICKLFNTIEKSYHKQCELSQVTLQTHCHCDFTLDSNQYILMDVLRSIIDNCFDHAFDFTDKPKIELKAHRTKQHLLIEVSDNGCGIPMDLNDSVLEPFITSKRNNGYYGLGLAIAQLDAYHELKAQLNVVKVKQGCCFSLQFEHSL